MVKRQLMLVALTKKHFAISKRCTKSNGCETRYIFRKTNPGINVKESSITVNTKYISRFCVLSWYALKRLFVIACINCNYIEIKIKERLLSSNITNSNFQRIASNANTAKYLYVR